MRTEIEVIKSINGNLEILKHKKEEIKKLYKAIEKDKVMNDKRIIEVRRIKRLIRALEIEIDVLKWCLGNDIKEDK